MIDLHCHILPGLDDGAGTLEDSLAMARKAAEDGIRTIVATPHTGNGSYENDPETILEAVRRLDAVLREEAIPLNIVCGAEVYVSDHLLEKIQGRRVLTVNDGRRYVVLELPVFEIPRNLPNLQSFRRFTSGDGASMGWP
jgi:protein-tyrosine phosphatase